MKSLNTNKLMENATKAEVQKELKIYMDTNEFKLKISKIVQDKIKDDKVLEDKVVEITKNVLTQLYKTLWLKKETWLNNLTNKKN